MHKEKGAKRGKGKKVECPHLTVPFAFTESSTFLARESLVFGRKRMQHVGADSLSPTGLSWYCITPVVEE